MKKTLPQEVEVWYLIPAIRRELVKIFVKDYNLSQRKSAELLGLTEAAISQYVKSKRGKEVKFSKKEITEIKKIAEKIIEKKIDTTEAIYELCSEFRGSEFLCKIHRQMDKSVSKNCKACLSKRH